MKKINNFTKNLRGFQNLKGLAPNIFRSVYRLFFLILLLFSVELTGCAYRMAYGGCDHRVKTGECQQKNVVKDADIMVANYAAADNLIHHISLWQHPDLRLVVTTIADIDNLDDSTSLGRLIGEQLAVRFTQMGLTVIEAKFYPALNYVSGTGEFILSRELRELGPRADIVVAGTYAVGDDTVYVTLKTLNFQDSQILSSHAYTLPIGPNTSALLQKSFWWWW